MQETWVWSLGQEDPLEKGMATHSNIPTWRIPWTEEPGGLESMGLQRVRQDWVAHTFTFIVMITIPVTLSNHWTVSAAHCALGTGGPITQGVDAAYLALCLSRPLRSRDWRTYHPGCRRCLPDIVGLLVAGQHGACNGLLQVLSLPPQVLLEIIFQGLYDVTQKEDSPGQVLSLGEKKREEFPLSPGWHTTGLSQTLSQGNIHGSTSVSVSKSEACGREQAA